MAATNLYSLKPIGFVRSTLKAKESAPMQGNEGAPDAWIEIVDAVVQGLHGIHRGADVVLITWLHEARRDVLQVHPRDDRSLQLAGVFATRSADRPNPVGLHRLKVLAIVGNKLHVDPLEAIDGTPVIDIKPVLSNIGDS
jgi:tRNA-Thr(GGU) m(6)t(6)A37 methyltransferase TsaA